MPKLWTDTIEAHKHSVHDAVLDAAAALIAECGLSAVSMSAVASTTGIGRATLYKYFPDVETILAAWHERQIARHLGELEAIAITVIGGTSLFGGEGTLLGALIGALIMGVLRNGLNLLNVSSFVQQFVIGVVIIAAVLIDTALKRGRR